MKIKMLVIPVIIIFSLAVIFILWQYVITIYEVKVTAVPETLKADNNSRVELTAVPLNAFGFKAPFRKSPAKFLVTEGNELIDIVNVNENDGVIILKAKDKPGKVIVQVKPKYSLMPSIVEIIVRSN